MLVRLYSFTLFAIFLRVSGYDSAIDEIPLEMIQKMNSVKNVEQFIDEFISKENVDPRETIFLDKYSEVAAQERSFSLIPPPETCTPQLTLVSLKPEPEPEVSGPLIYYFPSCTRINRCSGCCKHPLLQCQPTETENKIYVVLKLHYTGNRNGKMFFQHKVPMILEEHKKCRCDCITKESDCRTNQFYDAAHCKCQCSNVGDHEKCLKNPSKLWDQDACLCMCRDIQVCTTGSDYDLVSCKCI